MNIQASFHCYDKNSDNESLPETRNKRTDEVCSITEEKSKKTLPLVSVKKLPKEIVQNSKEKKEAVLAELASKLQPKSSIKSYLRGRKICFPAKEYFTGFHVEIENFVFEYIGYTKAGKTEGMRDKLSISVRDDREYYYGVYQLNEKMKEIAPLDWRPIGRREELDMHINSVTKEKLKLCCKELRITHNRIFEENVKVVDGRVKIIRTKLELPASEVIFQKPLPLAEDKVEEILTTHGLKNSQNGKAENQ